MAQMRERIAFYYGSTWLLLAAIKELKKKCKPFTDLLTPQKDYNQKFKNC